MLSVAMLDFSIDYPLIEAHTHCTKLLSKFCVKQCLKALVYAHDEAHFYLICSHYSHVLACYFDLV